MKGIKFIFFSGFILFVIIGNAQKTPVIEALNRISLSQNDTVFQFYTIKPDKKIKLSANQLYYWYIPDTIITTVGGYDGKLLNGEFKVYFPTKNFKEEGRYKYGIKWGTWKEWYPSGQLKSIMIWKKGKRDGLFEYYSDTGTILKKGIYKNDLLSGNITEYFGDGKTKITRYKKGKLVIKKDNSDK